MRTTRTLVVIGLLGLGIARMAGASELQADTLKAWDEYIRLHANPDAHQPFLWVNESPERRLRIQKGEVVVAPVVGHGTRAVPKGLIHDWIGAVFIPNATVQTFLETVHDYDRYKEIYKPVVADSKADACAAADQEFSMIWQRRVLFINAAMEGHYRAHDSLSVAGRAECPNCHEPKLPHRACPHCGRYKGREVIEVAEE